MARLVVHTLQGSTVVSPQRAEGPAANLLVVTLVIALEDGTVQGDGGIAVLDPVDQLGERSLGPGAVGLVAVRGAVRATGDEEETVELVHGLDRRVVVKVRVEDGANGFPVADGGGGRDGVIGFTVEVDDLAAGVAEGGDIGPVGHEHVVVLVPAEFDPLADSVEGDAVEGLEVVAFDLKEELFNERATERGDGKFPFARGLVVRGVGVVPGGGGLVAEVDALAVAGVRTVKDLLGELNSFLGDGAVLSGSGTAVHAGSRSGAVVRSADEAGDVVVENAEIGASNDAVNAAVESITGRDGLVHDLLQFARRREVVSLDLGNVRSQVLDLLEGKAESGSANGSTYVTVSNLSAKVV